MPLRAIPFCGQSYTDKTLIANAQEAINLYPMHVPSAQASATKFSSAAPPQEIVMYPTPGFKFAQSLASVVGQTNPPVRQLFVINNILYIVCGNKLLSFTPLGSGNDLTDGTFATLGTLNTSSGQVSLICNTVQLILSDSTNGYTYNIASTVFATIAVAGSFPAAGITNLAYYDGYAFAAINSSQEIIQSNVLDGTTWGAQAFDKITTFVDNIVAVFSDELSLYIFGPKITEVQVDIGSIPYAAQKIAGVLIQSGCAARDSIVKVANTVIWLASDIAGSPFIATMEGYSAKPISTPPMNEAIARYPTVSDAFGHSYREGDNHFYMITFPSAKVTWVYDLKMDMWHKRSINGGADLVQEYVYWQGNHVVGDSTGNLYLMSQNYSFFGNGSGANDTPLTRVRTCQHLVANGQTEFIKELQIDFEVGKGFQTDANLKVQPTNPEPLVTLEVSRDFGYIWHTVGTRGLGKQGKYTRRVIFRNLGRFRIGATFRLTITDPVGVFIKGARADVQVGTK